jgi:hypothetical protein
MSKSSQVRSKALNLLQITYPCWSWVTGTGLTLAACASSARRHWVHLHPLNKKEVNVRQADNMTTSSAI